jgi:hypothetical protein
VAFPAEQVTRSWNLERSAVHLDQSHLNSLCHEGGVVQDSSLRKEQFPWNVNGVRHHTTLGMQKHSEFALKMVLERSRHS